MTFSFANSRLKKVINYVDWKLLLFLLFFLNVKLSLKIPAIIIIYLLQFNFRFGFSLKNSRLPLFYLLIFVIASVGLVATSSYHDPFYLYVFFTGICFWILCLLAIHQVKLSVENNEPEIIHHTILVFFIINALFSFFNLAQIIRETGALNPYLYQGQNQKYFIGTGDYVKGVTFDTSITNAVLNAFGVIYFLTKKNALMTLVCMAVLILVGSNFTNIVLLLILTLVFAFNSNREQKSLIVICLMFLVVFMGKISPQNDDYVLKATKNFFGRPNPNTTAVPVITKEVENDNSPEVVKRKVAKQYLDSVANAINQTKAKPVAAAAIAQLPKTDAGRIITVGPDIDSQPYQSATDTTVEQGRLITFINQNKNSLPLSGQNTFVAHLPGKLLAQLQTIHFLIAHPAKIIAGDGIGNFSSKLAFRATGLGVSGGYPEKLSYVSRDFLLNHLDIYLNFFSKRSGYHSFVNSPFSVYDQLLAEYGLVGLAAFALCYLGFFAKNLKHLTYGVPLLALVLAVFFIDYWFEQLSILVFFELLLLLDMKETIILKPVNYE
jgi:hypothetical protein